MPREPYGDGETTYPKKIKRSAAGWLQVMDNFVSESKDLLACLDNGLDPNTMWCEADCVVDKSKSMVYEKECHWESFSTPLHRALRLSDLESAELLLSRGADINMYNANGLTPLQGALIRTDYQQARYLLELGSDPDKPTVEAPPTFDDHSWMLATQPNITCVQIALLNSDHAALRLLAESGVSLYLSLAPNEKTWTALDLALLSSDFTAIKLLWSFGLRFPQKDSRQTTETSEESARYLLELADSANVSPLQRHYPTYVQAVQEAQKNQLLNLESDEDEIIIFIKGFFKSLHIMAYGSFKADSLFCSVCTQVLMKSAKGFVLPWVRKTGQSGLIFSLGKTRTQIETSASSGCCLCAKIADYLDAHFDSYNEHPPRDPNDLESPEKREQLVLSLQIDSAFSAPDHFSMYILREDLSISMPTMLCDDGVALQAIAGRPVDSDTASDGALSVAKRWLAGCKSDASHAACQAAYRSPTSDDPMPARLLYIGRTGEPDVRVIQTSNACLRYCALSYCWGTERFITTTTHNLAQHEKKIDLADLPILLRQAVEIARRLDFEHIWIDALCIIQDNHADWEKEAANMGSIYSHADLTISPLASKGVYEPLICARASTMRLVRPLPLTPLWMPKRFRRVGRHITIFDVRQESTMKPVVGPVHDRGWTLQEQLLSTRVLFFGEGLLYFNCLHSHAREDDPERFITPTRTGDRPEVLCDLFTRRIVKGVFHMIKPLKSSYYCPDESFQIWKKQLGDYSKRSLTRSSDWLPAFYAVSSAMARAANQEFTAGIWHGGEFVESLCWAVTCSAENMPSSPPARHQFPSWSWVSRQTEITYKAVTRFGKQGVEPIVECQLLSLNPTAAARDRLQTQVQPPPLQKFASPFSSFTIKAKLARKGPMPAELVKEMKRLRDVMKDDEEVPLGYGLFLDYSYESIEKTGGDIYSFPLLTLPRGPANQPRKRIPCGFKGHEPTTTAMLVQRVKGTTANQFRRIGLTSRLGVDELTVKGRFARWSFMRAEPQDYVEFEAWLDTDVEVYDDFIFEVV